MRTAPALALVLVLVACSSASPESGGQAAGQGGTTTTAVGTGKASTTTAAPSTSTSTVATRPTIPGPAVPAVPGVPGVPGNGGPIAWTAGPWVAAGRPVNGSPAVFTTLLQPSNGGPAVGAAKLDGSRLRFALYAGTSDPGGTWSNQGAVAPALWPNLVATFNSGFQFKASRGGFYADGRAGVALRSGAASMVIFQDGSATVGSWGRDVQLTTDVVAVRQNLELLVDGGRPSPKVSTDVQVNWGFTLSNVIANWRSAVGIDAAGQVLYVGGPGLDPSSLASALIAVGALRAMELDINPAWVSFDTFTAGAPAAGASGAKLLATMNVSANHGLSAVPRDFFAVFAR